MRRWTNCTRLLGNSGRVPARIQMPPVSFRAKPVFLLVQTVGMRVTEPNCETLNGSGPDVMMRSSTAKYKAGAREEMDGLMFRSYGFVWRRGYLRTCECYFPALP